MSDDPRPVLEATADTDRVAQSFEELLARARGRGAESPERRDARIRNELRRERLEAQRLAARQAEREDFIRLHPEWADPDYVGVPPGR